jgi:hypothetical protein
MTSTAWSAAIGFAMMTMSVACSGTTTPVGPSNLRIMAVTEGSLSTALTTYLSPTITMQSDLTVSPSYVTVKAGYRITVVNNSARYAQFRSYNCSEFQMVNPTPGNWENTAIFSPAGKVCDYFAWDVNLSRKIFEGKVEVVP